MKSIKLVALCLISLLVVGCNTNTKTFIGYDKAEELCNKDINGEIVKSYKTKDDGKDVYEIEIVTDDSFYEFEIDAVTGKVLDKEKELIYETTGYEDALELVKEYTKATHIISVSYDDGNYEIEIQDEQYRYEIEVDSNNQVFCGESEIVKIR